MWIVVKRVNSSPEPARSEAKQAATRTDIQEFFTMQIINLEHLSQRPFSFLDPFVVEHAKETAPVFAESKALLSIQLH